MSTVAHPSLSVPAMSESAIDKVRELETVLRGVPRGCPQTEHLIHGGVYFRTVRIPADRVLTGALIKIATTLIVSGHVTMFMDDEAVELTGYHVIPASAGRKQAFVTHADTCLTMTFPTSATTVVDAESEFTNEVDLLLSRYNDDGQVHTHITGE